VRSALNKDYTFVRVERIVANGVQIDRIVSRDNVEDGYFVQAFLVVDHVLHVLTFYSPANLFEENLPIFDAILASYSTTGR
jgi:hypothetical protein